MLAKICIAKNAGWIKRIGQKSTRLRNLKLSPGVNNFYIFHWVVFYISCNKLEVI